MKAHEDTWEYLSGEWPPTVRRKGSNDKIADVWGDGLDTHEPADLISAAPEMARLLIDCQFLSDGCPRCGELMHVGSDLHKKDCKLKAVLVKAGVLEAGHT